ncbi:SMI1/KNR4 family protein [Streptomyces sp. NPDC051320]|uniref:SMI1/KNR4 family protein n=1 Tax=Streptomyces sp. NPDC051320 TaxID=3154644 RepID=UPI0034211CE5
MSEARDIAELWQRFESWLAEHAPGDYASLRAGASDGDIDRLEAGLGFPLHEDLRSVLELHNGVTMREASTEPGAFLLGYSLLDVDGILEAHRMLVSMAEDAYKDGDEDLVVGRTAHSRWVPLAQDIGGDLLFVDHRDRRLGEIGEMSFGDPEYQMRWPHMDLMLADLCDAVEHLTPVTSIPRVPSVFQGRMLEWPVSEAG